MASKDTAVLPAYTHLRARINGLSLAGIPEQLVFEDIVDLEAHVEDITSGILEALREKFAETGNNYRVLEAGNMVKGEFVPVEVAGVPLVRSEDDEETRQDLLKKRKRAPRMV